MKRQVLFVVFAIVLAAAFVLAPFSASDLIIRIYFDDIEGDKCVLYYATDIQNVFTEEQSVISRIDHGQKQVEFRLDGSLDGHLTQIRLDWPQQAEQLLCIKTITVSSAGVIQKEYSPCVFFEDRNIAFRQDVETSLVYPKKRAYLLTAAEDPYVVLSPELTREIQSHFSHRRISRLCLCLFLAGCCYCSKKKMGGFSEESGGKDGAIGV